MKHPVSISVLIIALLLLIISCSRKDMQQESISPMGNHYEQAMQLCEENRYAEAELILKEGELVAKARDNQLELQKCQGTRYLVARILSATTQRRNYELLHDHERASNMAQLITLAEEHGSITDVKVAKSVDPSLDKEASRVIKSMPQWIAGRQNCSPVRVRFTVPVTFKLQ